MHTEDYRRPKTMPYSLSFSHLFFTGSEPLECIEPSPRPTSVLQAILSLDSETLVSIMRECLDYDDSVAREHGLYSESMPYDILDLVRQTNTCTDLSSPVEVWIDSEGFYTLSIYDPENLENPEEC